MCLGRPCNRHDGLRATGAENVVIVRSFVPDDRLQLCLLGLYRSGVTIVCAAHVPVQPSYVLHELLLELHSQPKGSGLHGKTPSCAR